MNVNCMNTRFSPLTLADMDTTPFFSVKVAVPFTLLLLFASSCMDTLFVCVLEGLQPNSKAQVIVLESMIFFISTNFNQRYSFIK